MKDDAASLAELSLEEKRALLAERLRQKARAPKHLPMSFAQQRLWFLDQMQPGSTLYNITGLIRLRGPLDLGALRKAMNHVVRRHEVLRTTFAQVNEQPVQVVGPPAEVEIDVEDLRALPEEERRAAERGFYQAEGKRPFDLARGPLLRARLLWLEDEKQHLLFTMHHIISDGWSVGVLTKEVTLLYQAFAKGEPSPLPELRIQYADFAAWQLKRVSGEVLERQLDYWRRQLAGVPERLELPTNAGPSAAPDAPGSELTLLLPDELSNGLKALSRQEGATLFMTLLAAFQTLLHRYTGQGVILVGSPIAGRDRAELEPLIGFFVNTLLLRADFDDDPTFLRLLARVRKTALDAYAHQEVPFEKLVEELRPERSLGGVPLVQVLFTLQIVAYGEDELSNPAEFGTEARGIQPETELPLSKFDLTLSAIDTKGGLFCSLQYRTGLFDEGTIRRMLENFKVLLQGVVADPDRRVSELPMLTEAERRKLLVEWNETGREYARGATLAGLFEAQAARTPDATALVSGDHQLSYGELSRRARRLAGLLRQRGVGPEVIVGLFAEPSPEMVVGMLAVLGAGGAYLPLDPSTPWRRLAAQLDAARVPLVVTQQHLLPKLPERPQPHVLLDEPADGQGHAAHTAETEPARKNAAAAAYVIQVSDPDGQPRGVLVEEAQAVNNLHALGELASFGPGATWAVTPPFDANSAQTFIFTSLCFGATLHLIGGIEASDPGTVGRRLAARPVDGLRLAPSQLPAMLDEVGDESTPLTLRRLMLGGEPARAELVEELRRRFHGAAIFNHYAPTEAAGGGLAHTFDERPAASPTTDAPVGRPLPNTKAYVLDRHMNPVPVGVAGELYLGGDAPARGYTGRPEETAEKFVPDPFGADHRARLYRTGDLARRMPDGVIVLLGRAADRRVKVKGFRIEPEEVEALLRGCRGVSDTFVTAQEDARRVRHLVAYVVASEGEDEMDVQREVWGALRSSLPAWMLPSSVVFLDELPRAPDGSVDARPLPSPYAAMAEAEKEFVAPRNSTELRLARIWEELLGVSPVGVTDNFFDLGGHSLLAVRMLARVRKQFGRQVPLPALFERATVEHLAEVVRRGAAEGAESPLVAVQPHGDRRPFFCVHEIGGGVIDYVHLARHLGTEQPFYGLQAPGQTESDSSVEAAAARYLDAVREAQPRGPYLLGGWSFGGLIAFEMARQLQARGERVALLALFDSVAPGLVDKGLGADIPDPRAPAEVVKFIGQILGGFDVNLEELRPLAPGEQLARVFGLAREQRLVPPEIELEEFLAWLRGLRSRLLAERVYAPRPYAGSVTLFKAADLSPQSQAAREQLALDPTYGWGVLAEGGVETHTVPGSHRTLVLEPHVSALAERLKQSLARATEGAED